MKFTVLIKVFSENNEGIVYEKEFDKNRIPLIGNHIIEPLFAEPKKVVGIYQNLNCSKIIVVIEKKKVEDEALKGHIQEVAKLHNWEVSKSVIM